MVEAKVKVYSKSYKKKGSNGKSYNKQTVQKSISLSKNAPFVKDQEVIIIDKSYFDYFNTANNKDFDSKTTIDDLNSKLEKSLTYNEELLTEINNYKDENNKLLSELNNLKDKINILEDRNRELETNRKETLKPVIKINDFIINDVLDAVIEDTAMATTDANNTELSKAGLFSRLKGVTLERPTISESIKSKAVSKINEVNKMLLE